MKPNSNVVVVAALTVLVGFSGAVGCAQKAGETCAIGSEGCDCTAGGGCDTGLVCLSQLCVSPTPSGAAGTGSAPVCETPPCEGGNPGAAGSSGGAGTSGAAGSNASGAAGATAPVLSSFNLDLKAGTFWDYRWSTGSSSYGTGGATSGSTFRVALGDAQMIAGKMGFPVRIVGGAGKFAPRWKFLTFEDHVLLGLGGEENAKWTTILDGKTGLIAGGGFFAALPNVVFKARETTFSNPHVNGRGIVIERSSSTTDTVCVDGLCVKGSAGDTNLTQQEFYFPTFGPAGYHFFFSLTSSSTQGSSWEDVGLVATSLRGDKGLFVEELEPNDSPAAATQSQLSIVGTLGTSQASFSVTQTYYSLGGILIGTATDRLQDCYKLNQTASPAARIVWDPKTCGGCRMSIVMFDATGKATTTTSTSKGAAFDAVQAAGDMSHSDYYKSTYVCVGTTHAGPVSYVLY
jgi:hypothetical protein